ncbi:DUF371 domain-containing protein [Candidatus Woesearchaeota archaeon]|nr:DUF371 domain-containing protein [Candidatus Woesearchaeota archaeon]
MIYKFRAYGHPNLLATHKTTLEFTKDKELSLRGDCIVGVKADFELDKLKEFIKNTQNKKVVITIKTITQNKKYKKLLELIKAELNPNFNNDEELVIRKTDFVSKRTLATNSNKAAFDLNRGLIVFLRKKNNKIMIILSVKI